MFEAFPQLTKKNLSIWKVKLSIFCHVCLFFDPAENLNRALPELYQKILEVQDLSKWVPPVGNMTESMWRIKDVIEETRNYLTTVRSIFHWSVYKTKGLFLIGLGSIDNFTTTKNPLTPCLILSQLSLVTTFNGTNHVELHPPRDLEDLRAFTAVDLVLGRQHSRQRRRRDKRSHGSSFVLYLGSRNVSEASKEKLKTGRAWAPLKRGQ